MILVVVEDNSVIETGMQPIEARGKYHYCYTLDQTLSALNMMIETIDEEITSFEGIKRLSLDAGEYLICTLINAQLVPI